MKNTIALPSACLLIAASLGVAHCKRPTDTGTPPPTSQPATPAHAGSDSSASAIGPGIGAPPPVASLDPPAAPGEFRDAAQWLPQGEVSGWRQSGAVTRSTASNLFQIIDGAAPSYEQYGLRNFAKTDYRRADGGLVTTVEVYEFATALGAFGRYTMLVSSGRDPATLQPQTVSRGGGGYQGTTQLSFWKGRALVLISVSDASDDPSEAQVAAAAREALPRFGEALEHLIPGETATPPTPLPQEGMVWGGNTYAADGVFGLEQTGPAWIGYYRTADGKRYRTAIFMRANQADAQQVVTKLRGSHPSAIARLGDEAFAVANEANGEIVVARHGNHVFAIADGGAPGLQPLDRNGKITILRTLVTLAIPALPIRPTDTAPPS